MELTKTGYKQTEVGLIPENWRLYLVNDLIELLTDYDANGSFSSVAENVKVYDYEQFAWYVRSTDLENNSKMSEVRYVDKESYAFLKKTALFGGELLFLKRGDIGNVYLFEMKTKYATVAPNLYLLKLNGISNSKYLFYYFTSNQGQLQLKKKNASSTLGALYKDDVKSIYVPLPPTLTEQKAIATALSDVDALISSLEKLIAKKKAIKQGAMQELLTPPHKGGKRLAGFSEDWEFLTIELVADCLDNLRVPLNGEQRAKMNGDIPYCGANGVVDYVNDFVIDDDIILMAEDGGYFDEYKTRPIAYRMKGKCWVNNHAHILKAKKGIDQGFLYFSLVHKNILDYINGGTRAKLNKGEMNKIECWFPQAKNEQKAIAQILTDMDSELVTLEKKKEKYQQIKQGMMQELLTGKTRLV
jgi:type I restriction enzyme S subunit